MFVLEPNEQQTLQILQGLSERYERHHHCCYAEEALEAAVKLSHTYIADRFLPDKVSMVTVHVRARVCVCIDKGGRRRGLSGTGRDQLGAVDALGMLVAYNFCLFCVVRP